MTRNHESHTSMTVNSPEGDTSMTVNNAEGHPPTAITKPASETPEEMFGNWEVAIRKNSKGLARGKKIAWVFAFSFLIDILLTTGFFYNAIQTREATQQAAIATCISGNKARINNRHLWDYVLNLIDQGGKPSLTIVRFENYLEAATKQRACN
jgi:hypothetical protein